jgi:hypothetical protein
LVKVPTSKAEPAGYRTARTEERTTSSFVTCAFTSPLGLTIRSLNCVVLADSSRGKSCYGMTERSDKHRLSRLFMCVSGAYGPTPAGAVTS